MELRQQRYSLLAAGQAPVARTAKVLIIDDDPVLLSLMTEAFGRCGFTAFAAANGRRGLEIFDAEQPDLVVTDIVMPVMDGIAVIIQLRQRPRPPKIIAISSGGSLGRSAYLNWAKGLGADVVLQKPFRMSALIAAARELLGPAAPAQPDFFSSLRQPETGHMQEFEQLQLFTPNPTPPHLNN